MSNVGGLKRFRIFRFKNAGRGFDCSGRAVLINREGMLKRILLAALLLVSLPAAAEPMFPSLKSCTQAGSNCALVLDANNYLVDADSGDKLSDTAESVGAMNSFELYRDGDRYILENENFSQAKSRRWVVFDYDSGRVALEGAYVFSIDINPSTGPYWHGYDCRADAKLFARPSVDSFSDAALQELCGDAEGLVVSGQDSGVTVPTKGLTVSVPVYNARNRDGFATYLFVGSEEPDLSKLACLTNCVSGAQLQEQVPVKSPSLNDEQNETLCSADEDIYFSCPLTGGKTVSVCAQGNNKPAAGSVQYRYGVPGKIEMLFPQKSAPPKGKFFVVNASEGSVNLDIIKFEKGPYTYLVNQAFVSNLTVLKDDKVIFRQSCGASSYAFVSRSARQGIEAQPKSAEDFR